MSPVNFCSTFSRSPFVIWSVERKMYVSIDYSHGTNGINHVLQTDTKKRSLSSEFRLDEKHQRQEINRM